MKLIQAELQNANERITELETNATTTQQATPPPNQAIDALKEEIEAQTAIASKAKRVVQLAESEIDHLRAELRQSSDREKDIRANGRKAVKTLEEKLVAETAQHTWTKEENAQLREEAKKSEAAIAGLQALLEKKKVWFDEQLVGE